MSIQPCSRSLLSGWLFFNNSFLDKTNNSRNFPYVEIIEVEKQRRRLSSHRSLLSAGLGIRFQVLFFYNDGPFLKSQLFSVNVQDLCLLWSFSRNHFASNIPPFHFIFKEYSRFFQKSSLPCNRAFVALSPTCSIFIKHQETILWWRNSKPVELKKNLKKNIKVLMDNEIR